MPKTESNPSAETDQPQPPQHTQYAPPYSQPIEDDTIDLYELWITLWSKKWLVIAVTIIAALGSVVYALQQTPIYKAEVLLLPPNAKDVKSVSLTLNEANSSGIGEAQLRRVSGITASQAFGAFKKNLSSRSLQKKFIEEHSLMNVLAPNRTPETRDIEILESFAEMIKIEVKEGFSVSVESNDPEFAAKLVNDFVSFFDLETVRSMVSDAKNNIEEQILDIEYSIASKRQMAKQRREDQVLRYQEASIIANTLGIKKRVDATNIIQNTQMNVDIATASTPLYYLGIEALSAEIEILQNRKSDDPFISGLRDLQEQLALLRSFKITEKGMHSVSIDQAAYPPKYRIKPNRRLIVSLGTVVGLFLGIFLGFFASFIQNQKEAHSE
ncbi:MAG: Wzz/FepE/Etk N-terminal domain-containing protein [Nitrospinaceae bacterium]|nr:Wzz/FepE/Etk N-terminal domain-containing protein [Nitrospinaceae bacterium]